jgi:hypothetical protein
LLFILGLIDPKIISKDKRLSLFDESDFERLLARVGSFSNILILPNIWTEVDNLMNRTVGSTKYQYIELCKKLISEIKETYLESSIGFNQDLIQNLGLTDTLLLDWIKKNGYTLISIDSKLCDIAKAYDLQVIDLIKEKNDLLFNRQ